LHGSIAYFHIEQLVEQFADVFYERINLVLAPNGCGIGIVGAFFPEYVLVLGYRSKAQKKQEDDMGEFKVQSSRFKVQGSKFKVQSSKFKVSAFAKATADETV
jgi:hypothetical protein